MTARGTSPESRARGRTGSTSRASTAGSAPGARLAGVDSARGLALLGMMATHVLPLYGSDPQLTPTWVGLVFSGRAAALFAVLAGVGLALSTGKQQPLDGADLWAARRGVAFRALVVAAIGLSLGGLEVNIAIILVHYAVMFLCILPFLGLGPGRLLGLAAAWVVAAPALAFMLRPWLLSPTPALQLGHNPGWEDLTTPAQLLGDLFLTGYYPVFQWMAYLLVGLAIGRLALATAAVPFLLIAAGTVLAVLSKWLGEVMLDDWGGREALRAQVADPAYPLDSVLQVNLTGIEQTGSGWWLAVSSPHSGTTLDLVHTSGVAAAVLGICLLLGRLGDWVELDLLLPLRGAGALTLSLYTAHLCLMAAVNSQPLPSGWTVDLVYWTQVAAALAIGGMFARQAWRGPLEWVAHSANQLGRYQPARIR